MKNLDINIRVAQLCDVKKICEIEKECFSVPWSESSILSAINNGISYFIIAQKEDVCAVGYAGLYFVGKESYMYNIAVRKNFRNFGVGSKLMNNLKNFCRKNSMEFLSLETRKSNTAAIKLYENMGFKVCGERKKFYNSPSEDAAIMTLYF